MLINLSCCLPHVAFQCTPGNYKSHIHKLLPSFKKTDLLSALLVSMMKYIDLHLTDYAVSPSSDPNYLFPCLEKMMQIKETCEFMHMKILYDLS